MALAGTLSSNSFVFIILNEFFIAYHRRISAQPSWDAFLVHAQQRDRDIDVCNIQNQE